jgi:CheY-like chemotaxis protein
MPFGATLALRWQIETSLKILIVDDNAAVRALIRRIVLPFADEIWECTDGADGLAAYHAQRPDVVLMDIRMKCMDGIEATKRIRAVHPTATIVMLSDYDDDALRDTALSAGACGYTLKDNLLNLVRLLEGIRESTPGQPGTAIRRTE